MTKYTVRLMPDDVSVTVNEGSTISEATQKAGIYITHPCGGRGTCGRCIVYADDEPVKACVTPVTRDMTVVVPDTARLTGQAVLTDFRTYDWGDNVAPRLERVTLQLEEPTLEDAKSDATRLRTALAQRLGLPYGSVWLQPEVLTQLPEKLRRQGFSISPTVVYERGGATVLSVEEEPLYGIAIDIGTTTVVTALCDLATGYVLDTVGASNPQAEYGSDVISRIVYTEENPDGTETLQKAILATLTSSIKTLAKRAGINPATIPAMAVAANTTMASILLGLPTDWLRREPYVPPASEYPDLRPADLGLPILPHGRVMVLPAVSSYVGGDITAGVIATKLDKREGLNMLVDVGTNGEMVLAGDGFMVACSCSAGPAFEGSGISCGSRAVRGAIDNVYYQHGYLVYDIIGGHSVRPVSVCGSGLISLLSALQQKGEIDRSGRFTNVTKEYQIAPQVSINEADVLNLIRAKGAIFAGMRVLASHMETDLQALDHLYIAGGFGRNLNIGYATNIGMFPPLGRRKFSYVGNTSLAGALRVLNDRTVDAEEVAASILNLELSVGNAFMDEFTKACFLPHTDLEFYNVNPRFKR